jgi:hypothetical protein
MAKVKYYYDSENLCIDKNKEINWFCYPLLVASALFGSLIFVILLNTPILTPERPLVDS